MTIALHEVDPLHPLREILRVTHLTPDQIAALTEGRSSEAERVVMQAHLSECDGCLALVGAVVRSTRPVSPARLGRYEVRRALGEGAMGTVFEAFDPDLQRPVAVKRLKGVMSAEHERRLRQEAQTLAGLRHPNVVTVHDFGEDADGFYFVMQLVVGSTLGEWISAKKRGWREVVRLFIQSAEGLAAAHAAGVVHRDFKPSNVLVSGDDVPVVTDFGLARVEESSEASPEIASKLQTATGSLLGTPAYMAPEQLLRRGVTAQTDQFSFCVTLFEALTGTRPFASVSVEALRVPPRFPSGFPSGVRRVLQRGLAFEPAQRFANMDALARALRGALNARRRVLLTVSALTVTALLLAGGYVAASAARDACEAAPELVDFWSEPTRQQVRGGLTRLGKEKLFGMLDQAFQGYLLEDRRQRGRACAREVSLESREQRLRCLSRHLAQARTFRELVLNADKATASKAPENALSLLSLDDCTLPSSLEAVAPRSASAEQTQLLRRLEPTLGRVRALKAAGQRNAALEPAQRLVVDAAVLGEHPFHAEALLLLADVESVLGKSAEARGHNQRALILAEAVGAELLRADALLSLSDDFNDPTRGQNALEQADAIYRRVPHSLLAETQLHTQWASSYDQRGLIEEALASAERVLRNEETRTGVGSLSVAKARANVGTLQSRLGRYEDGANNLSFAANAMRSTYGETHPLTAALYRALSELETLRARKKDALRYAEKALAGLEASQGKDSPLLGQPTFQLARARGNLGASPKEVLPLFERARAISEKSDGALYLVGYLVEEAQYRTAQNDWRTGRVLIERACALAKTLKVDSDVTACWIAYAASAVEAKDLARARRGIALANANPSSRRGPTEDFEREATVGRIFLLEGRVEEGRARLEEVLARLKTSRAFSPGVAANYERYLARAYLLTPRDGTKALGFARAAKAGFEWGQDDRAAKEMLELEHELASKPGALTSGAAPRPSP